MPVHICKTCKHWYKVFASDQNGTCLWYERVVSPNSTCKKWKPRTRIIGK